MYILVARSGSLPLSYDGAVKQISESNILSTGIAFLKIVGVLLDDAFTLDFSDFDPRAAGGCGLLLR
jgi:hypothetical protein